jgi:hypothetical protein
MNRRERTKHSPGTIGTIRSDIRLLVVSKDVGRHRLISINYIHHGPCHGRARPVRIGVNLLQNSLKCRLAIRAAKFGPKADRTIWRVGGIYNSGILDVEAKNEGTLREQ